MTLHQRVSTLVGQIYEAASDPVLWDDAIRGVLEHTHSQAAFVAPTDLDRRELFQTRFYGPDNARMLDGTAEYVAEVHKTDPMLTFGKKHPHAGFVRLSMAVPPADQRSDEFSRWVNYLFGVRDFVTRYTTPSNGLTLSVALFPNRDSAVHDEDDLRLFEMLFGHINEALCIAARPPALEDGAEPALLVDKRGKIHAMNPSACCLIAEGDGLTVEYGFLSTVMRGEQRRLDALLHSALGAVEEGGVGGSLPLSRPSGRRPLLLWISPLPLPPSPFDSLRGVALVRIVDPEASPSPDATRRWTELFGLTPAETRLAAALLAGEGSLRLTADQLGIAYATARIQLANLFDKTSVRSQAQLARLLTRLQS